MLSVDQFSPRISREGGEKEGPDWTGIKRRGVLSATNYIQISKDF